MASTFEFISAQSPHTMKGVLVGLLFAVHGLLQLIETVLLFIFSAKQSGKHCYSLQKHHRSVVDLATKLYSTNGLSAVCNSCKYYNYRNREEE